MSDINLERSVDRSRTSIDSLISRPIAAAIAGTWLEYYDFVIYSIFALSIGRSFFPASAPRTQLLLSLATFGVGFAARPLGALFLGSYGDRQGFKAALPLAIVLMAAGTALVALTPPYAMIGLAAPALIIIGRLLQGFSAGGEIGVATTYVLAASPPDRKGFYGSWQTATQGLAVVTAGLLGYGLNSTLSSDEMDAWGWRIPFLLGLIIGPIGYYLRSNLPIHTRPSAAAGDTLAHIRQLFAQQWRLVVIGLLTILGSTISAYVIGQYMTTYAISTLHMPAGTALLASVTSGGAIFVASLVAGWLSDRFGRRALMVIPRILFVVAVYPAFALILDRGTPGVLLMAVALLSILQAMSGAVGLVGLAEAFPAHVRTFGLSIVFATGVAIFGGTAQLVVTGIIDATGDPLSLTWYLIATNLITTVALLALRPAIDARSWRGPSA